MATTPDDGRRPVLPLFFLTLVTFIWASNTIVSKVLLGEMTPELLALTRSTLASIGFYVPVLAVFARIGSPLRRAEWGRLVLIGTVGAGGSVLAFTVGITTTPATYAGFILMTAPIWTALLAWLLFRERLGRVRAAGMGLAFLGATLIATNGQLVAPDPAILRGSAFLILAQVTWALYTLLSKPLLGRHPPLQIVAVSQTCALGMIWPMTGWLGAWGQVGELASWSWSTWSWIAYLAFVNTALSQALYMYSLREVSAAEAISFQYLQPVFTALLAGVFLGEQPRPIIFFCGALILAGLWLVNRPSPRRPRSPRVPELASAPRR